MGSNDVLLQEAVVVGKAPEVVVKEDTVEFNADSYKTQPNSVVEDLLKKLPGVEVDSEGKITHAGKEITKILVDGKEFFSDDPKVASMRLRIHAMAQEIDSRLSIHDLRCVPGPTHTNVIFDCVRPSDLAMNAEDLKRALAKRVESEYPKSIAKITIDEDYVGHTHE